MSCIPRGRPFPRRTRFSAGTLIRPDGGGTLTHASVVSREYRVPCVVGTGLATQTIKDGDEITVDGDKGLVTVHRAA